MWVGGYGLRWAQELSICNTRIRRLRNVKKEQTDAHIAALQSERAALVARKLKDRVAQVDAELARLGVEVEAPKVEKAEGDHGEEKAVQERPTRRGRG